MKLADTTDGEDQLEIDILIGADFYWDFVLGDVIRGDSGPVALKTSLGWVLSGNMFNKNATSTNLVSAHVMKLDVECQSEDDRLDELVRRFWNLDDINVSKISGSDVLQRFEESVEYDNCRYTVRLPWKEMVDAIPDNYSLCKARLLSLLNRLKKNPGLLKEYDKIIREQEQEGIIENVDSICEPGSVH